MVRKIVAILSVSIFLATITLLWIRGMEAPTPILKVNPPEVLYDSLTIGQRFSIYIDVANVSNLKSFELKVGFVTPMLDVVEVAVLMEENLPFPNWEVNDAAGVIWMNVTYEGGAISTVEPAALARITFKVMDYGQSPLHLFDTRLEDSSGSLIPHSVSDGMVSVRLPIDTIVPSTTETYVGRVVDVTVVVKNFGIRTVNFTVKVYYDDTLFGIFDVINLAPQASANITFTWDTHGISPSHSYTLKARATALPYEVSTNHNVVTDGSVKIKIVGDVNNDDVVDINDLIAWDQAYGSTPGAPNWNPQADINGDGIVNKEDGILIIQNYRKGA